MKRTTVAFVAAALTALVLAPSLAGPNGNSNPGVAPPNANSHGQSYTDWADQWWRWAMSIPADDNPMNDVTGEFAAVAQEAKVWFLAGINGANGTVERTIEVPAGTALFFPIINNLWINLPELGDAPWSPEQEEFAREFIAPIIDDATELSCTIDGTPVLAIGDPLTTAYRVQTDEPFDVYLPEDDVWGLSPFLPEGVYGPSVQDGIYLLLNPLPPGEHTIRFTSTSVFLGNLFEQDVTYHITVVPGNKP